MALRDNAAPTDWHAKTEWDGAPPAAKPSKKKPAKKVAVASHAEAGLQPDRNLRHHVSHLELHQLVAGKRVAKLLAVQRVLPRDLQAVLRGAEGAPRDAVPGAHQAVPV